MLKDDMAEQKLINGSIYYEGIGVEENKTEAVKLWHKSAEYGNVEAKRVLGTVYAMGKGVEKNLAEAVKWWQQAAEQGNIEGQNALGDAYYHGKGVAKNESAGIEWWRKSAEQGNIYAQYKLARATGSNKAAKRNGKEATRWRRIFADEGDVDNPPYMFDEIYKASSELLVDNLPDVVIDEPTGVKIVFYDFSEHETHSKHKYLENGVLEVVSAVSQNRRRYKARVRRLLHQYPPEIIRKNLRTIYIVQHIRRHGISDGKNEFSPDGTYNLAHDAIYLVTGGDKEHEYLERNIGEIFHHEFSSFLLHRYTHLFPKEKWLALNPLDFQYGTHIPADYINFVPQDTEFYYQQCMTAPHSTTYWENDVNNFAQLLFQRRTLPWGWASLPIPVDQYPCLQKKLDLLASFYHHIHPMFTAEYFINTDF